MKTADIKPGVAYVTRGTYSPDAVVVLSTDSMFTTAPHSVPEAYQATLAKQAGSTRFSQTGYVALQSQGGHHVDKLAELAKTPDLLGIILATGELPDEHRSAHFHIALIGPNQVRATWEAHLAQKAEDSALRERHQQETAARGKTDREVADQLAAIFTQAGHPQRVTYRGDGYFEMKGEKLLALLTDLTTNRN